MFRKTILASLTMAVLAGSALGTTAATAGSYGGGYNGSHGGSNWNRHVSWCSDRYRSYRSWDNTYQPYSGPREICYSPYWGG